MSDLENKKSFVAFGENQALVRFAHTKVETPAGENLRRRFAQFKLSLDAGREVPLEEIEVSPRAGDEYKAYTSIVIKPGEPLYIGLHSIHLETPNVLPKLIEELDLFTTQNELDEVQLGLIRQAIGGLQEIVDPKQIQQ